MSDVTTDPPVEEAAPPEPKRQWIVICEVEGKNPGLVAKAKQKLTGTNDGGVIVRLGDNDGRTEEVARVGFIRRNTSNPDSDFKTALQGVLGLANDVAAVLNEQEQYLLDLLAKTKPGEMT